MPDEGEHVARSTMTRSPDSSIEAGVIDVLTRVSRKAIEPAITSDLIADLGLDSLQILEVIAELEDRFDVSIPLNDVPATRTVAQVVARVTALVESRTAI
jgi:acyl carrier protein